MSSWSNFECRPQVMNDLCQIKSHREWFYSYNCDPILVEIDSCVGVCSHQSYYIPGKFRICYACLPRTFTNKTVVVSCMLDGKKINVEKQIAISKDCTCSALDCPRK